MSPTVYNALGDMPIAIAVVIVRAAGETGKHGPVASVRKCHRIVVMVDSFPENHFIIFSWNSIQALILLPDNCFRLRPHSLCC